MFVSAERHRVAQNCSIFVIDENNNILTPIHLFCTRCKRIIDNGTVRKKKSKSVKQTGALHDMGYGVVGSCIYWRRRLLP